MAGRADREVDLQESWESGYDLKESWYDDDVQHVGVVPDREVGAHVCAGASGGAEGSAGHMWGGGGSGGGKCFWSGPGVLLTLDQEYFWLGTKSTFGLGSGVL